MVAAPHVVPTREHDLAGIGPVASRRDAVMALVDQICVMLSPCTHGVQVEHTFALVLVRARSSRLRVHGLLAFRCRLAVR